METISSKGYCSNVWHSVSTSHEIKSSLKECHSSKIKNTFKNAEDQNVRKQGNINQNLHQDKGNSLQKTCCRRLAGVNTCNSQIEQLVTKDCFRLSFNFNIFSLKSTRFQMRYFIFCTRKQKAEITLDFALFLLFPHISPAMCLGLEETFPFFFFSPQ